VIDYGSLASRQQCQSGAYYGTYPSAWYSTPLVHGATVLQMLGRSQPFTAVDLFCGCGGLTTGLKLAGFAVLGAVDLDELAVESYRENHPEVHVWRSDVTRLKGAEIRRALGIAAGDLDLLAGCPPCQGFSALRTMNGGRRVLDRQNDLIFEFLRVARALRPRTVMLENVPALATNRRLREVVAALKRLGYWSEFRVLDAADYGVPQRRKRLILLGSIFGEVPFHPPSSKRRTVRDAIAGLPRPRESRDPLHKLVGNHSSAVRRLINRIPKNGGSRSEAGGAAVLECHKRSDGFNDVYGRMAWDDVSPTITTGCVNPSRGRFLHPRQNRAITIREAALLQTFPKNYVVSLRGGKYGAARLIGNALPPEFIRRHARMLRAHLELTAH
jgi:DNA (cytosine-5)-methyltransferase 1